MLRRRLFADAVMFTLGIASGYLFFECGKYLCSVAMMLGVALVARSIDLEYRPERTEHERKILIAMIIVGFAVFTATYIQMNSVIRDENGKRIDVQDVGDISGRIVGITDEDDYIKLVIKPMSISCSGKIQLNYYNQVEGDCIDMLGQIVTVYGELRIPARVENPGCLNYRSYLYSRGIRFTYSCKYMKMENCSDAWIVGCYWAYRRKMMHIRENFLSYFSEDVRPFIKGIVFGDKSEIDEETISEFNANSTGHILAVSGLHVGFLFALLRILTRKKKSKSITAFIVFVIVMYGEMTGWSPSTARAVLVLSISILALYARRTPDLLTSVSAAAFIILFLNPYNLVNSGFQLSFLALLGICFLNEPLEHYVGKSISVLLAVQLAVAPMIAYSFCSFNVSSILINIPIVFLASILVPTCILALMIMLYAGLIPDIAVISIEGLTQFIINLNSKLTFNDNYVIDVKGVSVGMLVTYYLMVFFMASEWTRIKLIRKEYLTIRRTAVYLLIPILCISIATHNPYRNDEIVFVNVGQGDCTHIRAGTANVLIDGGGNQYTNVGKNTLKPYLLHNNVGDVDLALITHQHTDHYKGIEELSEIYPVKNTMQGYIGANARINDDVWIESIWPEKRVLESNSSDNINELNTVYIIHYENIKIMVTGDLTKEDEAQIIDRYRGKDTLQCDILKVGHHGSKTSSSDEFLDAVNPRIAVISVGAHNSYGHPHQETLDKLNARGITTYRTDLNGAIGVDIRGTVLIGILRTGGQSLKVDTMR